MAPSIQGVQTAITPYTLVMAAFMLLGAKLGDILGRNRAFAIGLAIYGVGSLATALSPNLAVLLVGWSGVEGFGAVLVVPAIAALTAASYEGRDRALAYAVAVAAAEQAGVKGGLTRPQARALAADYGEAQLDALRLALGAVALVALLSLWLTRHLPTGSLAENHPRGSPRG